MFWSNFHSHTNYCDGKGCIEDYVLKAIDLGMKSYGISSHNPLPNKAKWGMKQSDVSKYLDELKSIKAKYETKIELYSGMEIDYFPKSHKPIDILKQLDYWIGSIHFIDKFENGEDWEIDGSTNVFKKGLFEIFNNDIQSAISRYYDLTIELIKKWNPPILGHLDKIKIHNQKFDFFKEDEPWYQNKIDEILMVLKENKTIVEVNTRGIYKGIVEEPYPSWKIIEKIQDANIPIIINSDSHRTDEITGSFSPIATKLLKIGFKTVQTMQGNNFKEVHFDKNGFTDL